MMTKKHLEFLAQVIREELENTANPNIAEGIRRLAHALAEAFDRRGRGKIVTPFFNRTRFLVKSGVRDPYPFDQPYYISHFRSEEK